LASVEGDFRNIFQAGSGWKFFTEFASDSTLLHPAVNFQFVLAFSWQQSASLGIPVSAGYWTMDEQVGFHPSGEPLGNCRQESELEC